MNVIRKIVTLLSLTLGVVLSQAESIDSLRESVAAKDWETAKELGQSLTESEPENGEAYHLLGKAYAGLDEREAATKAFKEAVKHVTENADYYADYGYALIQRGQEMNMFQAGPTYMSALNQYKKAVSINPDHLGAHIGLARYYMNAPAIGGGSMKLAKQHAAEIARINPYQGHIEMALIAQKENRFEDAITEFESANAMDPDQAWVHFELGKLYQATNQMEASRVAYEKTLELHPEHKGAKAALEAF